MLKLLLLTFGAATAAAPTTPAQHYLLTATLKDGDRVVGSPALTIAPNQAARISIGDGKTEQYDLSVTATPANDGLVSVAWTIHAQSAFGDRRAVPFMTVRTGQKAMIEIGKQSKTARPFRVEFSVATSSS